MTSPRCPVCRRPLVVSVIDGVFVLACSNGHAMEQRQCWCGRVFWWERGGNGRPPKRCAGHRYTDTERPQPKAAGARR